MLAVATDAKNKEESQNIKSGKKVTVCSQESYLKLLFPFQYISFLLHCIIIDFLGSLNKRFIQIENFKQKNQC